MNEVYINFSDMDSKTFDRMYQKGNICTCPKRNHIYCKCPFNISHYMESSVFISKETRGKLTVHFHIVTSSVSPDKISSTTYITLKVKSAKAKVWRKKLNYLNE